MNAIMKTVWEAKKFGMLETADHILFKLTNSQRYKAKMFVQRGKYYDDLTEQQLEEELKELYRDRIGYELNLVNPTTFTEKIQWLKLHDCTDEKTRLADKYLVCDWVKEKIGEEYLIPLLGVWDNFDDIDFDKLPNEFCLKMNHGSGMNYIVTDKSKMNKREARKLFMAWKNLPFHALSLELQYRDIPRKIIAEKYMKEMSNGLYDYKIHCFCGKPVFIQCIGDRDLAKHTGCQNNYDLYWNKLDWIFEDYPEFPCEVPKPKRLDEMITCAENLSEGFTYVRVDLYEVDGHIYFGEMTFTPASGFYPYRRSWTRELDIQLGGLFRLPQLTNTG